MQVRVSLLLAPERRTEINGFPVHVRFHLASRVFASCHCILTIHWELSGQRAFGAVFGGRGGYEGEQWATYGRGYGDTLEVFIFQILVSLLILQ